MTYKVFWKSSLILFCFLNLLHPILGLPVWTTHPSDLVLPCENGQDYSAEINLWLLSFGDGQFSDGCGDATASNDFTGLSPDCAGADVVPVVFIATDMCGDTASRSASIIIQDILKPVFSAMPQDITLACTQDPDTPGITISDSCDPAPNLVFSFISEQTSDGSCTDFSYQIERFWFAEDACGNKDTLKQLITIEDILPPSFTRPADITIACSDDMTPANTGRPTNIVDNCDPNPAATFDDIVTLEGCPNNYTISRFWTVADACGNAGPIREQTIIVRDLEDPVFTQPAANENFDCTNPAAAESAFQAWVTNYGGAVASDNCTSTDELTWFAAVPGTYDINNFNTWPGTAPGTLTAGSCANGQILRSETVDFVVHDICNRASVSTATFSVVDFTAPVFEFCPTDINLNADDNSCQAAFTLPLPIISEDCDNDMAIFSADNTAAISSDTPGDENVIVNAVILNIDGIPTAPALPTGDVQVQIELINIDGEATSEYFNIELEDGTAIGNTNLTDSQCGSSITSFSITADDFKLLALDGQFSVNLIPNTPNDGSFGVNDICNGSMARMTLEFNYDFPQDVILEYTVDNGNAVNFDLANTPTLQLDLGMHTIVYRAEDCAGNINQCSYVVTVRDNQAPTITCPGNILRSLSATEDCNQGVEIDLPLPLSISEDCTFDQEVQTLPIASDQLITFAYDPNYLDFIAENKVLTYTNVAANAIGSTVRFLVELEGDIEDPEEYFLIYDENENIIAATRVGLPYVDFTPGDCSGALPRLTADINIPTSTYNEWASDGVITIEARANTSFSLPPPGIAGDGINPSCVNFPVGSPNGQNDGRSKISIRLEAQVATINYEITGATQFGPAPVPSPNGFGTHFFNLGESTVTYTVVDNSANSSSCSFTVEVLDEIKPTVVCEPTTIFINTSGTIDYTLTPAEIDAGSFDNCGISELTVSPNFFSCDEIGTTVPVTLTATDVNGNSESCTTMVALESLAPSPSYSVSLCGNDSLLLFANPPSGLGGLLYTFSWTGPNGFTSNLENPIILNASANDAGSYSVTIEGVTNCQSTGIVEVTLNSDIAQPTLSQPAITCEGDNLTLFVNIADGELYTWIAPNFSTINTFVPNLQIPNADLSLEGNWSVSVLRNGCNSPNANPVFIDIEASPNIMASNNGPVCQGNTIQLSANTITDISYAWSGPANFTAVNQNPQITANDGVYTVVATSINGCSASASTQVVTLEQPKIDEIVIDGPACLDGGTNINLIPTITGGSGNYQYNWTGPNNFTSITSTAVIPNATSSDNGAYQLIVNDDNNCFSVAAEVTLAQNDLPNTPVITGTEQVCAGTDLVIQSDAYSGSQVNYHWFTNSDEVITTIPSLSLTNIMESTQVQLYVEVDGCASTFSNILNINVQPQPDQPVVTGTSMICSGGAIQLETDLLPNATYSWTGPAGFSATVHNPSVLNAAPINSGSYQVQVIINDCPSEFSTAFEVIVGQDPITPIILPVAAVCLDADNPTIDLSVSPATATAGATYTWFEAGSNIIVAPASSSLNATISDLSALSAGTAEFYVIADIQGCASLSSVPVTVELFEIPDEAAFAGEDFLLCDANSVTLEAGSPGVGNGTWSQISGPDDPLLADPANANTVLSELEANQTYTFAWTLSNGACMDYDSDEVVITFEPIPQGNPDFITIPYAGNVDFNVKENDQIDILFFIDVVEPPNYGTLVETGEGNFTYQANDDFAGTDEFVYKVCNQNCPTSCTEAKVNLAVGLDAACDVPSIFSPNNDGINDSFIIPCLALDDYPNNRIVIFNQWGDEVYSAQPYTNDWRGTYNGEELPVGTYYYVVDFGTSQANAAGFIIIER